MNEKRLDGKAELEKAIAKKGDIDWSKIVMTNNNSSPTYSFLERANVTIEFENRDALLEALCERVFGTKPTFKQ